jgi:hypothetical protein
MARQEQAVSKLKVVIEDLDLALDDLEEALTITRNGLAKTINSFIAGKPLDEETSRPSSTTSRRHGTSRRSASQISIGGLRARYTSSGKRFAHASAPTSA